ncbi:MAG: hypothetical protein HY728_02680 [Candidatus Rokubacteria bacterium]|nr:hypothetical protein [Candidatus Rokubacteria bacterium]
MSLASGAVFRAFDADRLLDRARRHDARRFVTAWIRGLGDVAYIVGEFVRYVGRRVPGAEVTLLVRPGLEEAGRWIDGVGRVIPVEEWSRERTLRSPWGLAFPPPWEIRRALSRRGLARAFDAILPYPLGAWYEREFTSLRPALRWEPARRRFGLDFLEAAFPERSRFVVALNSHVGTGRYYDFDKEWGLENFARLVTRILDAIPESRLVLVDAQRGPGLLESPRIVDARGKLGVGESVSVIAASDLLVGLDAGPVNLLYFLGDVSLEIVTLLGRTSCFAPMFYPPASRDVRLTPVVGAAEDVRAIGLEEVWGTVQAVHARWKERATR